MEAENAGVTDMSDQQLDRDLQEFLAVREPGADLSEREPDEFALSLRVDLENYKKFPASTTP